MRRVTSEIRFYDQSLAAGADASAREVNLSRPGSLHFQRFSGYAS